jgi:hypothetical protein
MGAAVIAIGRDMLKGGAELAKLGRFGTANVDLKGSRNV